jgi:TonB family protein
MFRWGEVIAVLFLILADAAPVNGSDPDTTTKLVTTDYLVVRPNKILETQHIAYCHKVHLNLVRSEWSIDPPKECVARSATVGFCIKRNGNVSNIHLVRSSDDTVFDRHVLEAVKGATPSFGPLPEHAPNNVKFEIQFIQHDLREDLWLRPWLVNPDEPRLPK